jgi:DNA-binding response OmpR family regulator
VIAPSAAAEKSHSGLVQWVLVVISDPEQQRLVCRLLEEAGYAVETAASVEAALRCLEVIKPSMVIVDDDLAPAHKTS